MIGVHDAGNSDDYAALLSLRLSASAAKFGHVYTEVQLAAYGIADYADFVCRPGAEHAAVPALAEQVKHLKWNSSDLGCLLASEKCLKIWLGTFLRSGFRVKTLFYFGQG